MTHRTLSRLVEPLRAMLAASVGPYHDHDVPLVDLSPAVPTGGIDSAADTTPRVPAAESPSSPAPTDFPAAGSGLSFASEMFPQHTKPSSCCSALPGRMHWANCPRYLK